MNVDWSLVIAVAALLVSVLSPTLTSLVNNRHTQKMIELDFDQNHRIAAIESYIHAVGLCCGNGTMDSFGEYGAHVGEIYLYLPESLWPLVDKIGDALKEPDYEAALESLATFCKELSRAGLTPQLKPR